MENNNGSNTGTSQNIADSSQPSGSFVPFSGRGVTLG